MDAVRVVIIYKDSIESISVNGDEMLDLSAIQRKPIEGWFEPSGGRDGWDGLIREVQKQAGDENAELAFEFYGPQESKTVFERCIRQHGFGTNALSKEDIIKSNMDEARKAEHRGIHSRAFKYYLNAAAYMDPEAQRKVAEYYCRKVQGEDIGIDMNPQDAMGNAVAFYEKAAGQKDLQARRRLYEIFSTGEGGLHQDWEEALRWLQSAADCGDKESARKLAWHYQSGTGARADEEKAFSMYHALAESGDGAAQYELGRCCSYGLGTQVDKQAAFAWYKKAAEQGHAEAQCCLGSCYARGEGAKKDKEAAAGWYRKAAEQGHAEAQCRLGNCYARGEGAKKDKEAAAGWYRKAVEQGHAEAQCRLGTCCARGEGAEADGEAAAGWYRKAAEQGYAEAQCRLGNCYAQGEGVEADEEEAAEWYRKAAEQGYAEAQCRLGNCYAQGEGVEADEEAAAGWYRKAAEQGHAEAQYLLGRCCAHGTVTEDGPDSEAAQWYEKAAEQGHTRARYHLGMCCVLGRPRDPVRGRMWISKAAKSGDIAAQDWLGTSSYYGTWNVSRGDDFVHCNMDKGFGRFQDLSAALYWFKKVADAPGTPENMAFICHGCRKIIEIYEEQMGIEREDHKNPLKNMAAANENKKKYKRFLQTGEGSELFAYCRMAAEAGDKYAKKKLKQLKNYGL